MRGNQLNYAGIILEGIRCLSIVQLWEMRAHRFHKLDCYRTSYTVHIRFANPIAIELPYLDQGTLVLHTLIVTG